MRKSVSWAVVPLLASTFVAPRVARAVGDEHAMHGMAGMAGADSGAAAPLFEGLGKYHRTISTKSAQAQRYFDQGMNFIWGFNLHEAQRSFEQAAKLDPQSAMAEWGVAMSLGPHFNVPALPPRTIAANAHAQQALKLLDGATPIERGLVEAIAKRYADPPPSTPEDQKRLDGAYAVAMKGLMDKYPDDMDVARFFVYALLFLFLPAGAGGLPTPRMRHVVRGPATQPRVRLSRRRGKNPRRSCRTRGVSPVPLESPLPNE